MKLSEISSKIKNRTRIFINGTVDYSHITTKIDGEELKRANEFTNFPSKDPYYKLSIEVPSGNAQDCLEFNSADESETYLAAYAGSRIYTSKKAENAGKFYFSATSKGNEIRVYQIGQDGKLHKVALNGNELGAGCKVKIELQFFETKFGAGVGINSVIIDGPIKIYEGNNSVKGYDMADDTIALPSRSSSAPVTDDVATAAGVSEETPMSDGSSEVAVDEEPIGSTNAESNTAFEDLLNKFRAGQQ